MSTVYDWQRESANRSRTQRVATPTPSNPASGVIPWSRPSNTSSYQGAPTSAPRQGTRGGPAPIRAPGPVYNAQGEQVDSVNPLGGMPTDTVYGTPVITPTNRLPAFYGGSEWSDIPRGGMRSRTLVDWRAPIYTDGAQWTFPVLQNLGSDGIARWQRTLSELGFYKGGDAHIPGVWTETDANAMARVMGIANSMPNGTVDRVIDMFRAGVAAGDPYYLDWVSTNGGTSGGSASTGPRPGDTITQTSRQVNLSTENDARALLRAVLRTELGRAPSDGEVSDFLGRLNAAERRSPVTTTTTTTYLNEQGDTSVSSTSSGGVEPGEEAMDFTEGPLAGERSQFKSGGLFDALLAMVRS